MADIKIMVDSSADLSNDILEKYGIGLIPLLSMFGEKSYVIGEDITNAEFYKKLAASETLPKTSQTPYARMFEILDGEAKAHDTVIYFTLSSFSSGQNHSATLVRQDILENSNPEADIRIIDSASFSVIIGSTAVEAATLAKSGKSADEIIAHCADYITKWHAFLLVSDLTFLEKGGRMRKTTAILGNLLDIKPVLTVNNGLIEVESKIRGKKKIYKKLCDMVHEYEGFDESSGDFMIVHSQEDMVAPMIDAVNESFDNVKSIRTAEFGPLVGTYTGNGAIALIFRTK